MQFKVLGQKEKLRQWKFGDINIANTNTIKAIENVNPKYAKHALMIDSLIMKFAKEKFGGIEILELPMCKRCERPGMWDEGSTCYCEKCGNTGKTKTFREYLAEDIKEFGLDEESLEMIEKATYEAYKDIEEGNVEIELLKEEE